MLHSSGEFSLTFPRATGQRRGAKLLFRLSDSKDSLKWSQESSVKPGAEF